jgi:hypothetical protein
LFKYAGDISKMAQNIILNHCSAFDNAVDCTLGNGNDTDFLSGHFKRVYSFDIQENAVQSYKARLRPNVTLLHESHENIGLHIKTKVDCIMYNLGYLPGGDKNITTIAESSIASIKQGIDILMPGGIMSIAVYTGHQEGKREKDAVIALVERLPKKEYGVIMHTFLNRNEISPFLLIIEKNQ